MDANHPYTCLFCGRGPCFSGITPPNASDKYFEDQFTVSHHVMHPLDKLKIRGVKDPRVGSKNVFLRSPTGHMD